MISKSDVWKKQKHLIVFNKERSQLSIVIREAEKKEESRKLLRKWEPEFDEVSYLNISSYAVSNCLSQFALQVCHK